MLRNRKARRAGKPLVCLAMLGVLAVLLASRADAGQRHRWWQSGEVKEALRLSQQQTAAIEEIYASTQPALKSLSRAFEEERDELSRLIGDSDLEEWQFELQVDKVQAARSALNKARIMMLYRMGKKLTMAQQRKLAELEREQRRRWHERHLDDREPDR